MAAWARYTEAKGSSPPGRGARRRVGGRRRARRLIPAGAGSTESEHRAHPSTTAHPRRGGEHTIGVMTAMGESGSSPPGRGAHAAGGRGHRGQRLIPAGAGSTGRLRRNRRRVAAHPRRGGEHVFSTDMGWPFRGSSPPGRGAPGEPLGLDGRLIPAGAGSTRWSKLPELRQRAHPRRGGEHPSTRSKGEARTGSSPPGRGAQLERRERRGRVGLIPAGAGSTADATARAVSRAAHPRRGGEHSVGANGSGKSLGSSPPGRGAPSCSYNQTG